MDALSGRSGYSHAAAPCGGAMGRKRKSDLIDLAGHIDGYFGGQRKYSDTDIDAMIAAAGKLPDGPVVGERFDADATEPQKVKVSRRDELSFRVEEAALLFALESVSRMEPPPSAVGSA